MTPDVFGVVLGVVGDGLPHPGGGFITPLIDVVVGLKATAVVEVIGLVVDFLGAVAAVVLVTGSFAATVVAEGLDVPGCFFGVTYALS